MRTVYFEKSIPKILLTGALRPLWQNVIYSPLSPTRYVEIADASLPGPHWVRVGNRLSGVCATDLHLLFAETEPKVAPAALPGTDRLYLGHELVGQVTEVGPDVTTVKVGDRVTLDAQGPNCFNQEVEPPCRHCSEGNLLLCENASLGKGTFAVGGGWSDSFVAYDAGLYKIPDDLNDEAAVMVEPLSVGVRSVLRRLPEPDERVLVVGCGTIGLTVIQAARALSPRSHITAMARYPHQADMARRLGADEIIGDEDPYVAAARITNGKLYTAPLKNRMLLGGFDVIYDCVGTERTVQDCLRWARAGGTVVLVGVSLKTMKVDLTPVWYQEVDLVGMYAHGTEEWDGQKRHTYDLVVDMLLQGKLTADGFITHRFPLDQWRVAVDTALDKRKGSIKVALDLQAMAR